MVEAANTEDLNPDEEQKAEEAEEAKKPDSRGVMPFKGGETAALARVQDYIWDKDLLKNYFDTRNGMLGADYSTKFSPWLAHGCVSPRFIATECQKYEEERVANKSTYWVVFELLWRDFFKFFAAKHGDRIFLIDGTTDRQNKKRWGFDKKKFEAWKEGRTGYPLVSLPSASLIVSSNSILINFALIPNRWMQICVNLPPQDSCQIVEDKMSAVSSQLI